MVQCPFDPNHRIPVRSMERHKASCSLSKMGYSAEEQVLHTLEYWTENFKQVHTCTFVACVSATSGWRWIVNTTSPWQLEVNRKSVSSVDQGHPMDVEIQPTTLFVWNVLFVFRQWCTTPQYAMRSQASQVSQWVSGGEIWSLFQNPNPCHATHVSASPSP